MMQAFKTTIVVASLAALSGCGSLEKRAENLDLSPICPKTHGWQPWSDDRCNPPPEAPRDFAAELAAAQKQNSAHSSRMSDLERQLAAAKQRNADLEAQLAAMGAAAGDKNKLAAEMAAARQRIADLEKQLAECEARMADLRSQLDQSKGSLTKAEKDLLKALQPEISKGTVSVNQSGDALTINLASSLLFGSGQDQLKSGGTDALKRVGGVLKDFPEKQIHVAGYTDNVAIKGALKKKFPSNKELSDARANSAAQALRDGGVSSNLSAEGHADSNPIASNNTEAGRAKNRRVEVIVK